MHFIVWQDGRLSLSCFIARHPRAPNTLAGFLCPWRETPQSLAEMNLVVLGPAARPLQRLGCFELTGNAESQAPSLLNPKLHFSKIPGVLWKTHLSGGSTALKSFISIQCTPKSSHHLAERAYFRRQAPVPN